jgi:uncharacterized protein YjbI with pentapeptide repeats
MSATREFVLERVANKEDLQRQGLARINLSNASIEGVAFDRSDMSGANLEGTKAMGAVFRNADLREACFENADLNGANFEGANLEGAKLAGAKLVGANLARANLVGANLEGADLTGARLVFADLATANLGKANLSSAVMEHAELSEAYLGGAIATNAVLRSATLNKTVLEEAKLIGANLLKANLSEASLKNADLSNADMRFCILSGANLDGAQVTGAHVVGLVGTGGDLGKVEAQWLDISAKGDGSERVTNGVIPSLLAGKAYVDVEALERELAETKAASKAQAQTRRYLGLGDVIRGAELRFPANSIIECESILESCKIYLGDDAELIIGDQGLLVDCMISGPGKVRIDGKFYQGESPGIVELREVTVGTKAAVIADVAQGATNTNFSFAPGCALRMKISTSEDNR